MYAYGAKYLQRFRLKYKNMKKAKVLDFLFFNLALLG